MRIMLRLLKLMNRRRGGGGMRVGEHRGGGAGMKQSEEVRRNWKG